MLTYNLLSMTKRAVDSIRSFHNYDLFVVDNDSDDGTQDWLKDQGIDHVIKRTSVAGAQNLGLQKFLEEDYDYFILLNNDIILRYDTIDKLVEGADKTGAYGMMSTEIPNTPHWAVDSAEPKDGKFIPIINIPAGSYSCTILSRKCVEKVGFFNERYDPRYIEDNDYTLRMRLAGGEFVQAHNAIYWHYLGGVVKNNAEAKKTHDENWKKNVGIFREIYGIDPHEDQQLEKLGTEWRNEVTVDSIRQFVNKNDKASINIVRQMGGYGDILFTTVLAKELKKEFGDKIEIIYSIPTKFHSLLHNNPNIDFVRDCGKKVSGDFRLDLTDLEFRVELNEMQEFDEINSARTEIYLNTIDADIDDIAKLKPDYFVTEEEIKWAEEKWSRMVFTGDLVGKRIVIVKEGSNKLKKWPGFSELIGKLRAGRNVSETNSNTISDFVIDLVEEKVSFREAAAIVATSDLVISPDSGISNLAGALNIPVITIFSNRNKENFEKMFTSMIGVQGHCPFQDDKDYCDFRCPCFGTGPHRSKENIAVPKCLGNLTVDEVYEKVQELQISLSK
jgi:ADP-heptose:LPS heptosyltransferase